MRILPCHVKFIIMKKQSQQRVDVSETLMRQTQRDEVGGRWIQVIWLEADTVAEQAFCSYQPLSLERCGH